MMKQLKILTGQRTAAKKEIRSVAEEVAKKFDPEKIILFGSYVWGQPDPESDVDLLVIMSGDGSDWDLSVEISTAIRHLFPMDILVRSPQEITRRISQGDLFLKRVVEEGEVLYEQPRR
jgi:predicted nucleotidyltransferase